MTESLPPIYKEHGIDPPGGRNYERPVAWLLGRQLINSLKGTLLFMALGSKLDARDWMSAAVFRYEDEQAEKNEQTKEGEFWFDYIADTGDGMKATYSIAYLTMSNLYVQKLWPEMPARNGVEDKVELKAGAGYGQELPRGRFLFIGGDTAYHMSDYSTLSGRFQLPFRWAFADLVADGRISEDYCRRLFGIPANHDYYDQLDGFRRQFLVPVREEGCGKLSAGRDDPQLMIPGHRRSQRASYVALRLPFEWWLWGLDTEVGEVDERQRKFFREVKFKKNGAGGGTVGVETSLDAGGQPDKLIVVTSTPTTIFGKFADGVKDTKAARAFHQLGLPRPFLPEDELEADEKDRRLKAEQVRLDVSGDVHLYGRYWGPKSSERPRAVAVAAQPHADNYASVVSGIGGAFHHPSTTYVDEVQEQTLYPSEADSRAEVAGGIFKPWNLMNGGGVWLAGLIGALIIYFAATVVPSSRDAVNNFSLKYWLYERDIWGDYGLGAILYALTFVPIVLVLLFYKWFFEDPDLTIEGANWRPSDEVAKRKAEGKGPRRWYEEHPFLKNLFLAVLPMIVLTVLGVFSIRPYRANITPFGNSLLVLLSLVWAAAAVALLVFYTEWLFHKTMVRRVGRGDWALTWVLVGYAVLALGLGLWFFGKNNLMAYVVIDILFVLSVLVCVVGLAGLGYFKAGENAEGFLRKLPFLLLGLVHGLAQAVVPFVLVRKGSWWTLVIALMLVVLFMFIGKELMKRNLRWPLVAVGVVYAALMIFLPYLTARWLGTPALGYAASGGLFSENFPFTPAQLGLESPRQFTFDYFHGSWLGLVPSLAAGLVGALMSCVWLGWYLAVALCFHGHNNEVGGAARIERFKQFIRFRLTKDTITGYVIAVDDPRERGADLKPRLIDVFTLPNPAAGGPGAAGPRAGQVGGRP